MENLYPSGPQSVPETFTRPTSKYKLHAWLALAGLCLFVSLYFFLTYWFGSTAVKLLSNGFSGGNNSVISVIAGLLMGFLTVFMVKALFFIKKFKQGDDIEISEAQEPALFKFINKIADEAGAPRPHKVFLSPRVNAAVFYDLSLINLIYPTKKNLEIGLGLVNTLTLNEFKAVLAHEFGHFAQKTMAVGRWVYISRQIAAHIIAKRDGFDSFLSGLSRVDIRIAWIGWVLSIIVWSIRALVETVFMVVLLAERALSREMEFQADLVAVSLAGSDAIVHGLYRLEAAEDAWDRSVRYGFEELHEGKEISDIFALQQYFIQKLGVILDKPDYGRPPILHNASQQRVFKKNLASPPKMWATHPPGFEREENAKRIYLHALNDERSSWLLFKDPVEMKARMSKHIFKQLPLSEDKPRVFIETTEALAELDKKFNKIFHNSVYRGFYLNNSLVRDFKTVEDFYSYSILSTEIPDILNNLYPESLKQDLEIFENKKEELIMLQALRDKVWDPSGGAIMHEGKEVQRKDLPGLIEQTSNEVKTRQQKLAEHAKKIRTVHLKLAEQQDSSWGAYLKGLSGLIHYSEHTVADLEDAKRLLNNTLNVVLADGKVSSSEMTRLLKDANVLYGLLRDVYTLVDQVIPDANVLSRMKAESWKSQLEEFKLSYASESNIQNWLEVVDSWVNLALEKLGKLRDAALEELVLAEEQIKTSYQQSERLSPAPIASSIPSTYSILLNGNERKLQSKLSLWERFYIADGLLPTLARLGVAAGIIGGTILLGYTFNKSKLIIYNGLSIPVVTEISDTRREVAAHSFVKMDMDNSDEVVVETKTLSGELIEKFEPTLESQTHCYIYNVAGSSAMSEWEVYYSTLTASEPKQTIIGSSRWFVSDVDHYFEEPPATVSTSGGSATRRVLTAYNELPPSNLLYFAKDQVDSTNLISAHARWDDVNSKYILFWLTAASEMDNGKILEERLENNPGEIVSERLLQDIKMKKDGREKIHSIHQKKYEAAPENGDLYYLAARSMEDGPEQNRMFLEGYKKWPKNGWLAFAGGYVYSKQEQWKEAEQALTIAIKEQPCLSENISLDIARIYRLNHSSKSVQEYVYPVQSFYLDYYERIETGAAPDDSFALAYGALASGKLEEALELSSYNASVKSGMIRMVAASDGSSDAAQQALMKLQRQDGLNMNTLLPTIALLAKKKKDIQFYLDLLPVYMPADESIAFGRFIKALEQGISTEKAEEILKELSVQTKGVAYSYACVFMGQKTPENWRQKATKLLFASERPYFK